MDFDKYTIRLSIRACCIYEQLTGKNFFHIRTDDEAIVLMYAAFVTSNDLMISLKTFMQLLQDKKVAKWIEREYQRVTDFSNQMKAFDNVDGEGEKGGENVMNLTMTQLASSLIMQHGIDPHYVMNEMQLWEIMPFFTAADELFKTEMVEKRFWTYMQIMPHINTKKCKGPDELIAFAWEKEHKKSDFEKGAAAAATFFARQDAEINLQDNPKNEILERINEKVDRLAHGSE